MNTAKHHSPLLVFLLAIAVLGALAGTLVSGQFCTDPDAGGCDDKVLYEDAFDADGYGWPIVWRQDMSEDRWRYLAEEDAYLADLYYGRTGISWIFLPASIGAWFLVTLTAEEILLGGWQLTRFVRSRHQVEVVTRD